MKPFLSLFFFLTVFHLHAQSDKHCGADEMRFQLHQEKPGLENHALQKENELENFTQQFSHSANRGGPVYIIPVVFHVIHNYGAENISDAQIIDAIRVLNLNYRHQNPDSVDIV
ncbi:MAG: hypothetical protein K1X56_14135, partial [Flavobacteriales bacterium]|nr:hypothetical protein [Flavobacteriales bacterium]